MTIKNILYELTLFREESFVLVSLSIIQSDRICRFRIYFFLEEVHDTLYTGDGRCIQAFLEKDELM